MKITVEDLKKVKLGKGDVLVVTVDYGDFSQDDIEGSLKALGDVFTKNEILFVSKGMDISVITKEIIND